MMRRGRHSADLKAAEVVEAAVQEPVEQGGWWTGSSTGAAALAVTAVRRTAWALLVAGPLLGGWALVTQPEASARPQAVVRQASGDQAGPAGFAEMYVAAYLRAGEGSQDELAVFYPGAGDLELAGKPGAVQVGQVAAVRVKEVAAQRYWSITVAARVLDPPGAKAVKADQDSGDRSASGVRVRYFQVPLKAAQVGGTLVAATLPAEVSMPAAQDEAVLAYGPVRSAQASDPAVDTLTAFFGAYLAGHGELARYVSPGTRLAAVRPAPYESVTVDQLRVAGASADDGQVGPPSGRERLRLVVQVRGERADGVAQPLAYALTLAGRDGRWEVAALDATPALNITGPPSSSAASPPTH
ncbi:conjugal transfer protein [Streptomyces sp. NPDC053474]|uniref:conjugal transfer protein n=1 Tax=Streptomyces sp. NPDC053474 TaxID=3365704 RepID=UPI0037D42BB7